MNTNFEVKGSKLRRRRRWRVSRRERERHGLDCLSQMALARTRPDVLANALLDMGITESGDGVPDKHFR